MPDDMLFCEKYSGSQDRRYREIISDLPAMKKVRTRCLWIVLLPANHARYV